MARERNSRPSSCEEAYRRDKHTRESSGAFTEHYELHKVLASRKCAIPVRALNKGTDLLDVPSPVIRPDRPRRDDRTSTRHERAEARASSTSPYDKLLKHDKVRLDIFWLEDDTLEDSADLPDPDVLVKIMRKKCKADSLPLQL
jgi:hypothetical protein